MATFKSCAPIFVVTFILYAFGARAEESGFRAAEGTTEAAKPSSSKVESASEKVAKPSEDKPKKKKKKKTAESQTSPQAKVNGYSESKKEENTPKVAALHGEKTENHSPSLVKSSAEPSPASARESSIMLRIDPDCFVVEFESSAGEVFSCSEPLPIRYTRRDCGSSQKKELAQVNAIVTCEDERRIGIRFKTSSGAVFANLRVQRDSNGKKGIKVRYQVESARTDQSSIVKMLPEPNLLSFDDSQPEEMPLALKFSGFAAIEQEYSRGFGFTNGAPQMNANLLSNIQFEATKGKTGLITVFEVGEMYFGDTKSGGNAGGRAPNIFEVRNIFLSHSFTDSKKLVGGLAPASSDPRAFIFADHLAGLQLQFKSDLSEGALWGGTSASTAPPRYAADEYYAGIRGTLGFLSKIKTTVFSAFRYKRNEAVAIEGLDATGATVFAPGAARSTNYWAGATFEWDAWSPFAIQTTGIYNWVRSKTDIGSGSDKYGAWLADAKMTYAWAAPQINFSIEGMEMPQV